MCTFSFYVDAIKIMQKFLCLWVSKYVKSNLAKCKNKFLFSVIHELYFYKCTGKAGAHLCEILENKQMFEATPVNIGKSSYNLSCYDVFPIHL